jgi:short-subunit dehydrogenase
MCDVCERASVNKLKDEANRAFGPVSLLFANAGVSDLQRFTDMSDTELDWVIQVDLMGVSHCMKAFLPDMIVAKSGHVMATASTAGMMPASIPFLSSYAMAKAGVLGLMLCLRVELATVGVGCTVLCPGQVATQIQHSARNRPERFGGPGTQAMNLRPDDVALFRKLHKEIKTRTPEEVAQMVLTAVRKDRPMVLTDPAMRQIFQESYVDVVMSAFDDAEAFDKANI